LPAQSGDQFSNLLSQKFFGRDIVFILFYTKLLTEPFLSAHSRRIFNCHPSILPSCKGLDGFGDTLSSNSLFMGCTLHEVDSGVDTGMSVIQAAIPLNRRLDMSQNRQKIFLAQYYSTLQFIRWTTSDRINSANNWQLEEARYEPGVFSPNLDSDFFDYFKIKNELRQYPMQKD
jgi:phosphoribosylglycinamide formyltransferase-1